MNCTLYRPRAWSLHPHLLVATISLSACQGLKPDEIPARKCDGGDGACEGLDASMGESDGAAADAAAGRGDSATDGGPDANAARGDGATDGGSDADADAASGSGDACTDSCVDPMAPCDVNHGGCDALATCDDVDGAPVCTCPGDYDDVEGDGSLCLPKDADGDGIHRDLDACPEGAASGSDFDLDGCFDVEDSCPMGSGFAVDDDADGCQNAEDPARSNPTRPPRAALLFVAPDGSSDVTESTGSSWSMAFRHLQDALTAAKDLRAEDSERPVQVWVHAGRYAPHRHGWIEEDETASFSLVNGVSLLGGFRFDTASGRWRRDRFDQTILDGDIGEDDNLLAPFPVDGFVGTNACHVVTTTGVDRTAVLDGFRVRGGDATDGCPQATGGGIWSRWQSASFSPQSSPTLQNLLVEGNRSASAGGGMYAPRGEALLRNVTFRQNVSLGYLGGGGAFLGVSTPSLIGARFEANEALAGSGGGLCLESGSGVIVVNAIFDGNESGSPGAAMQVGGSVLVANAVFSGNFGSRTVSLLGVNGEAESALLLHTTFVGNDPNVLTVPIGIDFHLVNSIIWGNGSTQENSGTGTITYDSTLSEAQNPSTANGAIEPPTGLEPSDLFVDPADPADAPITGGDHRLRKTSTNPAIDGGRDGAINCPLALVDLTLMDGTPICDNGVLAIDMQGDARHQGTDVDLGAYEAAP